MADMGNRQGHISPAEEDEENKESDEETHEQHEIQNLHSNDTTHSERTPSTVHVMFSHGQPHSFTIRHDTLTLPLSSLLSGNNDTTEGGVVWEEEDESSSEGNGNDDASISTLQLLARLLGGNLRRRFPANENPAPPQDCVPIPVEPLNSTTDLYQELKCHEPVNNNLQSRLRSMQYRRDMPSLVEKTVTSSQFFPRHCCLVGSYEARVFCGTYSSDGNVFISAGQSDTIDLYNTKGEEFVCYKSVIARDVGWSVLSTDLSPDQNWFIYSTWSSNVHLCNVYEEEERHYSLDLRPEYESHFCAFVAAFSGDNREILASANDGNLYVYDREKQDRILVIDAHQDDASAVTFADPSGHLIYSGGDDGVCKVWDRRCLQERSPRPVGVFAGHKDGITFIDSKGDERYLITNCKDQTIKLWDTRKFSNVDGIQASMISVAKQRWDYRWQQVPGKVQKERRVKLDGDSSVMTYTGHMVKNTLIRCRFSPFFTTGQKYIYTGCASGQIVIYDIISGKIVSRLRSPDCIGGCGYSACVRDVSWHPHQVATMAASTWDGTIQLWTYDERQDYICENLHEQANYFNFW